MGLKNKDHKGEGEEQRVIDFGHPERNPPFADNSVKTSKYTWLSFFPYAVREQFRRNGNIYFACIGFLMFLGYYTPLFYSAINPWTTLGPLALVVSVSLAQEAYTDTQRHRSDNATNYHPCTVLRRAEELDNQPEIQRKKKKRRRDANLNGGKDLMVRVDGEEIPIAFEQVFRMNMFAGDIVFVRNREMIPADLILLASANEGGNAYVETSSIDGETNLKLRSSPQMPAQRPGTESAASSSSLFNGGQNGADASSSHETESFRKAVERVVNMSLLGHPDGVNALANPSNADEGHNLDPPAVKQTPKGVLNMIRRAIFGDNAKKARADRRRSEPSAGANVAYIAALTSEPPNAHVNNYNGKLTLPPDQAGSRSEHAPLNAENILLRGAVLRNTEWVIGLACFTGADTKLVMNSVATPSKFSQLDMLINRTVVLIFFLMLISVCSLGWLAVDVNNKEFDQLWYAGYNKDASEPWPYFNLPGSESISQPKWDVEYTNWFQNTMMFVTMLSNFIPLSLYVTVEIITVMMMLYVGWDLKMYHRETDTRAAARSTIVTDLGLVEYIFSDKTGTLTCNIMEFKRCSVDGHVFGMPVAKSAPKLATIKEESGDEEDDDDDMFSDSVHPLKHLLAESSPGYGLSPVEDPEENGDSATELGSLSKKLTFNAEMFLRVMSICHTVVVEKDHVAPVSEGNSTASKKKKKWSLKSNGSKDSKMSSQESSDSMWSNSEKKSTKKKSDGAAEGFTYQAESPDEGALVSAASNEFGFQLLGRSSAGVRISCSCPSLLQDESIVEGLKSGKMTPKMLAAETAGPAGASSKYSSPHVRTVDENVDSRVETWPILAINKFDSDRKRMSVLVRSPPELGSVPMLLCKGADSSMMIEGVCEGARMLDSVVDKNETSNAKPESETDDSELDALLGLQANLGEFASEGLRTLVLAVKVLSEDEAEQWLAKFSDASTSIDDRDKKLTNVAYEIEQGLHIVGATAIEDKLQDGVPETIANLEKAGIKLWVLTGDKRETAIEIGYSTKVLTPKMHLTQVVDGPPQNVKTLVAMELMRHIKIGNLPDYQLAALDTPETFSLKSLLNLLAILGNLWRKFWLAFHYYYLTLFRRLWLSKDNYEDQLDDIKEAIEVQKRKSDPRIQRRKVRELARKTIKDYWNDPRNAQLKGKHNEDDEDASMVSDDPPAVFERAKSAKESLKIRRQSETKPSDSTRVQKLALAKVSVSNRDGFDEKALSMHSYRPGQQDTNFDKKKRTVAERLFAVDKDVRHGKLGKHLKKDLKSEYRDALALDEVEQTGKKEIEAMVGTAPPEGHKGHFDVSSVKRGLILEGAALKHILDDPVMEEMLFAVASCSESVIACRVSPMQKALLLKMVRKYVSPTPTTLAIGDGANDVGMIQEAHIGIGISGLEGQQAVNASDFSIAQFRFLESLLLIHGRWNFMRMSKAVLYFFYKNAALMGMMMVYSDRCLHSGTTLFDPWVISAFNFVGGSMVCLMLSIFDRDLPRDYVLRHPEVYQSGPRNEFLSLRMTIRWVILTVIQVLTIYYFSAPALQLGGGVTSAFQGLMGNHDRDTPGDGEGGDLKVFGTTIYSQLIYTVTFKALFETRSLVHGEFPTFTCRKGKGEGWWNRMGYTWVGATWFSILFYIWFLYMYELIGRKGPEVGTFFPFVFVTRHMFNMRSITWMVSILTPTIAVIFDVTGKVYSNMFYPTQTQIHMEIAANERGGSMTGKGKVERKGEV